MVAELPITTLFDHAGCKPHSDATVGYTNIEVTLGTMGHCGTRYDGVSYPHTDGNAA